MRVQSQCVMYYILVAIEKKAYRNVGRNTETETYKNDIVLVHTTAHCNKAVPYFDFWGSSHETERKQTSACPNPCCCASNASEIARCLLSLSSRWGDGRGGRSGGSGRSGVDGGRGRGGGGRLRFDWLLVVWGSDFTWTGVEISSYPQWKGRHRDGTHERVSHGVLIHDIPRAARAGRPERGRRSRKTASLFARASFFFHHTAQCVLASSSGPSRSIQDRPHDHKH